MTYKPLTTSEQRAALVDVVSANLPRLKGPMRELVKDLEQAEVLLAAQTVKEAVRAACEHVIGEEAHLEPPRRIAVMFTVNDVDGQYRVTPTINEDGEVFVGRVPGYPIRTFDSLTEAIAHAESQVRKFCAEWMREGYEVTAATVVTPTDCIDVDLAPESPPNSAEDVGGDPRGCLHAEFKWDFSGAIPSRCCTTCGEDEK